VYSKIDKILAKIDKTRADSVTNKVLIFKKIKHNLVYQDDFLSPPVSRLPNDPHIKKVIKKINIVRKKEDEKKSINCSS
jgi:hypothetical protein